MPAQRISFEGHEPLSKAGDYGEFLFRFSSVDITHIGTPEEAALTAHVTVSVRISRTLQNTWSLQSSDLTKVLFEYAKRYLMQVGGKRGALADGMVDLNTTTAPKSCPYDPARIAMHPGCYFDVETKNALGFRTE